MRARFVCAPQFDARAIAARVRAAGDRALLQAGEQVRTRAAALAPRRSGSLAASGRVEAGSGTVTMRFTAPYAQIQHERGDFRHPGGGQAGYLRAAVDASAAQALADCLARELGAGI